MSRNNHLNSRTRRTLARVAVASALVLAPVTALAVPAFAAPVEPADGLDAVERPGHGRHGHGHGHGHGRGHGHGGHGSWNRGHDHDHDWDWDRGRHGRHDWDRGHHGRGHFPLPSTGSAF